MPEHTTWFTYLMSLPFFRQLESSFNDAFGCREKVLATDPECTRTYPANTPITLESIFLLVFVILLILLAVLVTRARIANTQAAVVPEKKLTVSSFLENFVEIFYNAMKGVLGPDDAKYFLPIVGTSAVLIFFSNALALIPGFAAPTSNFNVTLGCGLIVFVCTHWYGFKRAGVSYLKHFVGPFWWLFWLMIPVEILSHCIRPFTLGIRLALNMYIDHMLVGVFTKMTLLLVPVAIMLVGVIVVVVQTYVFCLLSTIYIALAIEHHDEEHALGPQTHPPHRGGELPGEVPLP
jgi:F-type H+-transporting ATPase subunit a